MSRKKRVFSGMGVIQGYRKYSRVLLGILLFGVFSISCMFTGSRAKASSASISLQARDTTLVKGDTIFVLVTVSSMDDIYGFEGYFSYDNRYLRFVSGGKLVHGNDDAFRIQDVE
ncbi:MAG: hypothetical protein IJ733_02135 [Lachnospiraceae bacterium]|nr:hypothetical protein [Lachnospiraceae bacterium]